MTEAIVSFSTKQDTLPEWLFNRLEEIKVSAYGEAINCVLIVDTDERLQVHSYGTQNDNQTLRLINEGRQLVKAKYRMD